MRRAVIAKIGGFRLSLFCLLMLVALGACNRQTLDNTQGPRVALVLKTLNNPFFIDMQRGAEAAAQELGVQLIVQAAEREVDVEKQMQIVENLIQTQISALCITPSGSREIIPAIAKANEAGIPVVILDTRVDQEAAREAGIDVATFVGSDNYEGGRVAGSYLAEHATGSTQVVILEGIPGHETADSRLRGFHDAISSNSEIKVIASQPANWERDQGFNVMQNLLQAHQDIDAVFACNDLMALGAVEAIAAAGKTDEIKVIGFDAIEDAREAIRQGLMVASVAQFPGEIGQTGIENAVKAMDGEILPDYIPVNIELITSKDVKKTASGS